MRFLPIPISPLEYKQAGCGRLMFIERHCIHAQALHRAAIQVECAFGEAKVSQATPTKSVSGWRFAPPCSASGSQSVGPPRGGKVQPFVAAEVSYSRTGSIRNGTSSGAIAIESSFRKDRFAVKLLRHVPCKRAASCSVARQRKHCAANAAG